MLPVDQAEELFGVEAGEEAGEFLTVVAGLLRDAQPTLPIVVAATVRADRFEPLQTAPQLAGLAAPRVFEDLRPMPPDRYREVICGPAARAQRAGSRLQWAPELVERLLADCAAGADALPLLSLTLARLYEDYGDGVVGLTEYEAMGGMRRVVETEIDAVLSADPDTRERELQQLHDAFIPWLAAINPANDEPLRRAARWVDLPADSHPLIEALVARRLLVKDERDGTVVVEVALESLLRQWDTLAGWLRDEAADLKNTDAIEQAARDWEHNARHDDWLLPGERLAEAEALAAKPGFRDRLNAAREYLLASRQRDDRRAKERQEAADAFAASEQRAKIQAQQHARVLLKRTRVLYAVLALVVVVAVVAVVGFVKADNAREDADARFRDATASSMSERAQLVLAGQTPGGIDDVIAMQALLAALAISDQHDAEHSLLTLLNHKCDLLKVIDVPAVVTSVAFSPDGPGGPRIASGYHNGTIRLWNPDTGKPIGEPLHGTGQVNSLAFSPDGLRLVAGDEDGTVRVWDTARSALIRELRAPRGRGDQRGGQPRRDPHRLRRRR